MMKTMYSLAPINVTKKFDIDLTFQTGALDLLAQNPGNILRWLTDHNGKLRVAVAVIGVKQKYFVS